PTDAAIALADNIHHLLVDEFQDTSRSQHRLLGSLLAAWPDNSGRSLFLVGDPMQSIYYFRGADAELFPQVRERGLELPTGSEFLLQPARLRANFRTDPAIVNDLNTVFQRVFAEDDGSGITFAAAEPAREPGTLPLPRRHLHCTFMPGSLASRSSLGSPQIKQLRIDALRVQTEAMLDVIRAHMPLVEEARGNGKPWRIAVLARAKKHLVPLAHALHQAAIPFRAVELEDLTTRPEIRDALALVRAVLNPHARVAWLGILRAPWCSLSLSDLHILAGDQDASAQTIPDLLVERCSLLSTHGQAAVQRLLHALHRLPHFRSAQPLAALGTQMQHLWLHLGGQACVDATALDNLDLLWSCLDALPAGEADLLGPALDAALESLTAQPDAAASSSNGVQLMTIHKSKGLEFEVVLIPELQASTSPKANRRLLSWIERGLAEPTPDGEITEFLIAPLHARGQQSGSARSFVERVSREHESQESRRLLYVAATRAREELHFFARPEFRIADGGFELLDPRNTLLATSWPALQDDVLSQFAEWKSSAQAAQVLDAAQTLTAVAASQDAPAIASAPPRPALLHRLPADFVPPSFTVGEDSATDSTPVDTATPLYDRHEGGPLVRALGIAVHTLFQELARLRASLQLPAALEVLRTLQPGIVAHSRAAGLTFAQAQSTAVEAFALVSRAADDPLAQWILAPHPDAAAEAAWTGLLAERLRTVRVDRVFRAGSQPLASGDQFWWIIDYKTAHANSLNLARALPELHVQFAPQLETYAAVLRLLHGPQTQIRAALYYPRLLQLDWWEA
ncbi:MAG TPA: 3'-5' exonuclease, partial [Terracidiphilus sp.]|nr:3'-5' exonuclease [Terracidiphilus sp.]